MIYIGTEYPELIGKECDLCDDWRDLDNIRVQFIEEDENMSSATEISVRPNEVKWSYMEYVND